MLKKICYGFFVSCIAFYTSVFAQQVAFEKHYNFGATENGFAVTQTFDGGYCVSGDHRISFSDSYLLLLNTDSIGIANWTKFIGPSINSNEGYDIKQTSDSGYITTGQTGMVASIYLNKTDKNGDTLWTKHYGYTISDMGCSVQSTFDHGYAIAGEINDTACLIKTDSIGNLLWKKSFIPQGGIGSVAYSLLQTNDSGFVFTGTTAFAGYHAVYVVKTDSNGDSLWTKIFNRSIGDYGYSIENTYDGGYIICGTTWGGISDYDFYLLKLNNLGDTIWTKVFGVNYREVAYRVRQTIDVGYIIMGRSDGASGFPDFYLLKTDVNGDSIWSKTFGASGIDYPYDLQKTIDGGFILVGSSDGTSYPPLGGIYLIKTDSLGNVATGISESNIAGASPNVFPNPNPGKFYVRNISPNSDLRIFNFIGEEIYFIHKKFSRLESIDISDQPNGIYFLRASSNQEIISIPIIINH